MKSNEQLQKDVMDAIKWEPLLNAAEIGVTAKDGIITLTGTVSSYIKKSEAEDAAKSVNGVKAVVENIEVAINGTSIKSDSEIAHEVLVAFNGNWAIPNDNVKVKVEEGWVSLDGELRWNYQRDAAKRSVSYIFGVKGITNNIKIKSETFDEIEKKDIERALLRNWSIDDRNIQVNVSGNMVTLFGTCHSLYQKEQAARIAWNAPGVWDVKNDLVVEYND